MTATPIHATDEAVIFIGVGPSIEYADQWRQLGIGESEYQDKILAANKSFITERSPESEAGQPLWITTLVFESPFDGHYSVGLSNLTKDQVKFDYKIMINKR